MVDLPENQTKRKYFDFLHNVVPTTELDGQKSSLVIAFVSLHRIVNFTFLSKRRRIEKIDNSIQCEWYLFEDWFAEIMSHLFSFACFSFMIITKKLYQDIWQVEKSAVIFHT